MTEKKELCHPVFGSFWAGRSQSPNACMVRDSYCGILTCDLPVSVLIQGTPRSAVCWGTSEFPGQLIALLIVAHWLER